MKRQTDAPMPGEAGLSRLTWAAYAVGFLCFAGGLALLVAGSYGAGVGLSLLGVLLVTAVFLAPSIPWRARMDALRAPARAAQAAAAGRRGQPSARGGELPPPVAGPGLLELASRALDALLAQVGDGDSLSVNRMFLLVPAVLLLILSAALSVTSTVQGVGVFVAAGLVLWVYFQDMLRPLTLPHLRRNSIALLAQVPALPVQALGIWILNAHYNSPRMVWSGFFVCALASAWMYRALRRWPFILTEDGAPEPPLGWTVPSPFYTMSRWTLISSLLVASAIAACLAEYVFPADHAALAVGMAFLSMLLLIGSFPWIPRGLAFSPRLPGEMAGFLALAATALAFALGAHGQDLIEKNQVNAGLWFFLVGGIILIASLSRFMADSGRDEAEEAGSWPKLEMLALALLVVVAFCMRVWKIGSFPFGVEGDEGGGGVWAMNVLNGNVESPLIHENYPLAFFSVTALFFRVAGIGLDTLRWHAVFFGTVSVATTYFFLRLNMGRMAAFLSTLLMAFSYWHLHYSRFGHYNIDQVAMQMIAFYFVFKAFRTGRLWQWAVGGLAFGMAMFPHMAGRILPFQGVALVLFFCLARRDLLRRHLPGFLAFVVLAWAISSPAVVYWNRVRSLSMGRIQSVSIFDKNNTNAPIDTLAGFVRNCKVSMLMFNFEGDTRTRDNPVAPDKILEHWTAILFALAFIYVLYHWREPVNFFLLAVFFLNLCASVFSVEAPQSLRTAGNIPIVFAFMAVPLADLEAAMRRVGRLSARAVFAVLLVAFAFFSWRSAIRLFVDERRMAFDTNATYIAQVAGREGGPDTQGVFWGTGFASSHPPMQLLRGQTPLRNFYGPFEYLPITIAPDKDNLLFLADDYQQILPYVQWLYPKAPVRAIPDLEGAPPLAQYIRVNKDVIQAAEGLDGQALMDGRTVAVTGSGPRWPSPGLEGARRISVSGSVYMDQFGRYGFNLTGEGNAQVVVDGKLLFSRRAGRVQALTTVLAKGLHDIEVRLEPASGRDQMQLQASSSPASVLRGGWYATVRINPDVDRAHLLRMRASGFYGEYFTTAAPQGQPVFENVEPIVLNNWLDPPYVGNWSARWRTRFKVGVAGNYRFSVRGGSYSHVKLDNRLVWRSGQLPGDTTPPAPLNNVVHLAAGWHDYEAAFSTGGAPSCELQWTTPNGAETVFWVPDMQPLH